MATLLPALAHAESTLRINEVLASNSGGFRDEAGEADDWIELYNLGDSPLDPSLHYVTDNLGSPTKWQIPAGTAPIPPGGFLLLWADSTPAQGPLHTTYNLSAGGEEVGLFAPDGTTLLDSIVYGAQTTNISLGRFPDGVGDFQFMPTPSPLATNIPGFADAVAPVLAIPGRGFHSQPLAVTLATETPGAQIRYTLNGATPTQSSALYTAPIPVDATTVLRARAFRASYLPTPTATHTYIQLADVVSQSPNQEPPGPGWPPYNNNPAAGQTIDYGMDPNIVSDPRYSGRMEESLTQVPTYSIVTDLPNLFDPVTGMYVNAGLRGEEFERPVSVELLWPDGRPGFHIDAGARMRGSSSLQDSNPKHGWRLFFRNEYGDNELEYPLFDDEGVAVFKKVDLRCEQNFSFARGALSGVTMMREVIWRDAQAAMGQPYTRSRQCHLYVNGHYWGLHMTQERADAWFAASYLGGEREDYDVIKANAEATHVTGPTDGDIQAWQRFWEMCNAGFRDDVAYYRSMGLDPDGTRNPAYEVQLDEQNLIDYMLIVFYSGSVDGPLGAWSNNTLVNNYYAIRPRDGSRGWIHLVHDFETTGMSITENRLGPFPAGEQLKDFSAQWIHQKLMEHPEYRMRFADRAQRHLFNGGVLTHEWLSAQIDRRAAEIDAAVIAETARWGDSKQEPPATLDGNWLPSVAYFRDTFFQFRGSFVLPQLRSQGLFPATAAPVFTVDGVAQHGGDVEFGARLGFGSVPQGATIHYTTDGTDPRLPFTSTWAQEDLVGAASTRKASVPTGPVTTAWRLVGFNDATWLSGTGGGVGYETSTGYEPYIAVDVRAPMYNVNQSCLVRIPFTAGAAQDSLELLLQVRSDDGFVAYLNGTEVARRNAPAGTPAWNAGATAGTADSEAVLWASFDVSSSAGLLVNGPNVLAVHGLNTPVNSSDFLVDARLVRSGGSTGGGEVSPGARPGDEPLAIVEPTTVKARVLSASGEWSALSEATFAPGLAPGEYWMLR